MQRCLQQGLWGWDACVQLNGTCRLIIMCPRVRDVFIIVPLLDLKLFLASVVVRIGKSESIWAATAPLTSTNEKPLPSNVPPLFRSRMSSSSLYRVRHWQHSVASQPLPSFNAIPLIRFCWNLTLTWGKSTGVPVVHTEYRMGHAIPHPLPATKIM